MICKYITVLFKINIYYIFTVFYRQFCCQYIPRDFPAFWDIPRVQPALAIFFRQIRTDKMSSVGSLFECVIVLITNHGTVVHHVASQLPSSRLTGSIIGLLSVRGFACSPHFHVGFLWVLRFSTMGLLCQI